MRAGQLRHPVTIQTSAETVDAFGEPIQGWSSAITAWASIAPLSGQERLQGDQVIAECSHRVRMRHDTNIATTARLLFGSRVLEIVSAADVDERGAEMDLLCKEVL